MHVMSNLDYDLERVNIEYDIICDSPNQAKNNRIDQVKGIFCSRTRDPVPLINLFKYLAWFEKSHFKDIS